MDAQVNLISLSKALESLKGFKAVTQDNRNANLMVTISENSIKLFSTDLVSAVAIKVSARTIGRGSSSVIVSLLAVSTIINDLAKGPDEFVNFETCATSLKIAGGCGCATYIIHGVNSSTYLERGKCICPPSGGVVVAEVYSGSILGIISSVFSAASVDKFRYIMNGVFLEFKQNSVSAVATDGRRLAVATSSADSANEISFIVPRKSAEMMMSVLPEGNNVTVMSYGKDAALFESSDGTVSIVTRLVDGIYPSYRSVIPAHDESNTAIVVQSQALNAVKSVSNISSCFDDPVIFDFGEGRLEVSCTTKDHSTATTVLGMKYSGKHGKVGVNQKYVMDAISGSNSATIQIEYHGPDAPLVVKSDGYMCLVMPLRM